MIGALRSRNRWKQGLSGGWLLIAAELVHDANAAKAKTANFDYMNITPRDTKTNDFFGNRMTNKKGGDKTASRFSL